jgi:hypothetical protein
MKYVLLLGEFIDVDTDEETTSVIGPFEKEQEAEDYLRIRRMNDPEDAIVWAEILPLTNP